MTTMTRFVPFRTPFYDFAALQSRLNENAPSGGFVPAVDVSEDAQQVVLTLEVPGVKQEDLDIRVENQKLTVKGERKFEAQQKEGQYHRIERRFGSFTRSFTLPQSVDTETVKAQYEAGVLTISVNKKAEAKPKQVKIEVSGVSAGAPETTAAATNAA